MKYILWGKYKRLQWKATGKYTHWKIDAPRTGYIICYVHTRMFRWNDGLQGLLLIKAIIYMAERQINNSSTKYFWYKNHLISSFNFQHFHICPQRYKKYTQISMQKSWTLTYNAGWQVIQRMNSESWTTWSPQFIPYREWYSSAVIFFLICLRKVWWVYSG